MKRQDSVYMFQFLIGNIKSAISWQDFRKVTEFQFLIGNIKSAAHSSGDSVGVFVFQFLIGNIKSFVIN